MTDPKTWPRKSRHTECVVCKEPRPNREPEGHYVGLLPNEWQFNGRADEMGGIVTDLTCSAACRFLGGYGPSPFDV